MKGLRFGAYYHPEITAGSHLLDDLFEGFANAGIEIAVYVPSPSRGLDDAVRKQYKRRKTEVLHGGRIIIHRFPMIIERKSFIQRALRYLLCNISGYFYGIKEKDVDIVLCSSTPPTQGLMSGLVARRLSHKYKHHVPFVYNLQDIFPDSMVNAGLTKKGSIVWKIGRKIEDFTYKNADKIIVISNGFKRNIMEKGVPEDKIVVIPNWVNTDNVYPVDRKDNVLFDRYNLDRSKFYICYSGNLGHSQNLGLLVDTAKSIKEELPDVVFILIGEGAAKEQLEESIKDNGLDNIIILPFQPYEDIAHVFSLGDAGLIISKPGIGGSSVPSKTWSIMAAERPILASFDCDSELYKIIKKVDCGVCASADNLDELLAGIHTLYENRMLAMQMGIRGRCYVREELNKDVCVCAYIDVLKAVLDQ